VTGRVPLRDVIDVASGQVDPRVEPYLDLPHVGGDNIESGSGRLLDFRTARELNLISGKYEFGPDDVLYSKIRPALNKVALPDFAGICSADMYPLRPRPGRIERRYLAYLLRHEDFLAYAEKHSSRTNIPKINRDALLEYEILLPPIPEQRRIADILDKADAIRRKRKEAIALTDDLLRSAFLEMFGDPVTNPKGWPVKPLGDVAQLFAGNSLPSGVAFNGQEDGFILMKVGDMNTPGNEVEIVAAREWTASVPSASVVAPAGAVLIPKRGGAIATNKKRILTRPAALDPNLMAIAPSSSLQLGYLRHWFEGVDLSSLSNGSAVPQLNKKDLAPLTIPVPSLDVQATFDQYDRRNRAMRIHAEASLRDADVLFAGLVARAFSGALEAPR
jgi:type I restriction enzyme S subunit